VAFEEQFYEFFPETVTVRQFTGRDRYGRLSHDAGVPMQCRIVRGERTIIDPEGNTQVAGSRVYFAYFPMDLDDLIVFPDGTSPPPLLIEEHTDEKGPHHTVVYFSRTVRTQR
jgi:hypothetical protein